MEGGERAAQLGCAVRAFPAGVKKRPRWIPTLCVQRASGPPRVREREGGSRAASYEALLCQSELEKEGKGAIDQR